MDFTALLNHLTISDDIAISLILGLISWAFKFLVHPSKRELKVVVEFLALIIIVVMKIYRWLNNKFTHEDLKERTHQSINLIKRELNILREHLKTPKNGKISLG